ncbi:threonine-phosphate decarboxylase [Orenia metallireducens]|uniref:threonine-phosphate decarboxylase n=1 Tax=Orenia metallireducens TaxID=1413210 RepID=A0A1C0A7C2_9FIRM|nr:threonine-phosphate decarboxylase [Orenia metallireducens]
MVVIRFLKRGEVILEHIHGGNIKGAVKKYDLDKEKIIDFSANINFLGPPEAVNEEIKANIGGIVNYPEPNSQELKDNLANKLNLSRENIIMGNGAVELIYLLTKVLNPSKSMVLSPTFSEYAIAAKSVGAEVEEFPLDREDNFKLDINTLLNKLDNVDLLFLCNPNNPTGNLLSKSEVIQILDYTKDNGVFLLVDEAFVDFVEKEVTVIDLINDYDNLFVLRSLTKFFAIPGLRVGYGVANQELIQRLSSSKDPWNLNYFAQIATKVALEEEEYIKRSKISIKKEKEFLYNKLKQIEKLRVYYPQVNYIFIDISATELTASYLENTLAKKGILIRNCNSYSGLGEDFIRVAVKSRADNLKLLSALEGIIDDRV